MPTIRDVAARAGVSVGLVSAVLNSSAPVSEALRARVVSVIDELGYVPNAIARSLKLGRTRAIGLVMPDLTNPHFAGLAMAIERVCDAGGFTLTLCNSSDDHVKELRLLRGLRQRVDGLVFIPGGASLNDPALLRAAIPSPVVLVDRRVPELDADTVLLDNQGAARRLTELLIARGHRRIAMVAGRQDIELSRDREAGYRAAMQAHGLPHEELVAWGEFDATNARRAALHLVDRQPRPTALLSASNHTTIGIMNALAARGLRCPDDLSVAAIDDFSWAEGFHPRLTVAAQPIEQMGREAAAVLLDRVLGRRIGSPQAWVHEAEVIVRESVGEPVQTV